MEKKLVPTHKYKTTIVFFDDDKDFLKFLENNLTSEKYNFYFVDNYAKFNDITSYSETLKSQLPNIMVNLDNELTDSTQHTAFDFDLSKFDQIKNYNDKNNEISVAFIDNNLGSMNGVDICASLDTGIKKILLTGECDLEFAIQALNDEVIHTFIEKNGIHKNIEKSETNIIEKIYKAIDNFTDDYFLKQNYYSNSLLSNHNFKELFDKIVKQYDIVEYYLYEKDLFILVDSNNKEWLFKCWRLMDFEQYHSALYDELDARKNKILDEIKDNKKILIGSKMFDSLVYEDLYYCVINK